jgi:[acyl-carrier-protein] S-malonyltransferase
VKTAFLCAGQGAQQVGMGRDLYEAYRGARAVFEQAEAACGLPLRQRCFEGPPEALSRTDVAQPAIFTVSAAALAALDEARGAAGAEPLRATHLAGLSLGEYTALCAAGAMDLATAVRLLARRGELMQQAAEAVPSGMVVILGLDEAAAGKLCQAAAEGEVLTCANVNAPGQIVLSGHLGACRRAAQRAEAFGAAGAVPLAVAGAFHSELMAPAVEPFREALARAAIRRPDACVVANVDARPHGEPDDVRDRLARQLVRPVRWQACVEYLLAHGLQRFYEIGPGRVLRGLLRRIHRPAKCTCIDRAEAIEKLAPSKAAD